MTNKAFIGGKIYNVVECDELNLNMIYMNQGTVAVHFNGWVLPVYTTVGYTIKPGLYLYSSCFLSIVYPTEQKDIEIYSDSHMANFGNAKTFQDVLTAKEKICQDEHRYLNNNDDVFIPHINQNEDSALMFAVKSAIAAKQCNINNYAERFGSDFNNDKRKFNGNTITAGKAESILANTDVRVTLVVQDMRPDVPNPIGKTLIFPWIGDGINDEAYVNHLNNALSAVGPIKLGE